MPEDVLFLPQRVWVDSGPSGTPDPGARIMVFKAVSRHLVRPPDVKTLEAHTTVSMGTVVELEEVYEYASDADDAEFMPGYEGSDLVSVYYALRSMGDIIPGRPVEIIGDGGALEMLAGRGKVSARWAGKNWAPDLVAKIREVEEPFPSVSYTTVPSPLNQAGALAKELAHRNRVKWMPRRLAD